MKLTGISADGVLPGPDQQQAAIEVARRHLPRTDPLIAFLVVHQGEEALWVLLGWWRLDILYRQLFRADLGTVALREVPPDGPTACVWELLAIENERRAWVDHVLTRPAQPDFDSYLAAGLSITAPEER